MASGDIKGLQENGGGYYDEVNLKTLFAARDVLTAELDLGENFGLVLDAALSADGKYSGIMEAGTAGATLAFGEVCYFAAASSRWLLAKADSAITSGGVKLGICVLAAASSGSATKMLLWGKIRADAKFPTLTIGANVYLSAATSGIIVAGATNSTTGQPPATDNVIRVLGFANTADELFFNPSSDYMTHT
jgi:hypothetical protein